MGNVGDIHTREPVRTVFGLSDTCKDPPPAYMEPQEKEKKGGLILWAETCSKIPHLNDESHDVGGHEKEGNALRPNE